MIIMIIMMMMMMMMMIMIIIIIIIIVVVVIAVETLDVFNASAHQILNDLGRRIFVNSGEARETSFLYKKISISVKCSASNSMLSYDSLPAFDNLIIFIHHKW